MVLGLIGRIEVDLAASDRLPGKINWTSTRREMLREYLDDVTGALQNGLAFNSSVDWGREGVLSSWGLRPTDRDSLAESVILLEVSVDSLKSASADLEFLRREANAISSLVNAEDDNAVGDTLRDISSISTNLVRGAYLTREEVETWRDHLRTLGGTFHGSSFYQLAAPSSPVGDEVRAADYWKKRNRLHMTGDGRSHFAVVDGEFWTHLFITNWRICQRGERDELLEEAWTSMRNDPDFGEYLRREWI